LCETGEVYAWLEVDNKHILNLVGEHIAFIDDDSVYHWHGEHIGWWENGHMRDDGGVVVVFLRDQKN